MISLTSMSFIVPELLFTKSSRIVGNVAPSRIFHHPIRFEAIDKALNPNLVMELSWNNSYGTSVTMSPASMLSAVKS